MHVITHNDASSWWMVMIHHDALSLCIVMMHHNDESSWLIITNRHNSSWWLLMIHSEKSLRWCITISHDDESLWFVMMNHDDASWWITLWITAPTWKDSFQGCHGPFCHGRRDICPMHLFAMGAFLRWLPWHFSTPGCPQFPKQIYCSHLPNSTIN